MITEETLTSLRNNDERLVNLFVYLDDFSFGGEGDEDDISLLEALRHNTRVTAVDCDMHLYELGKPLQDFMTGVGKLENLQTLRCSSSGDYAVTMAALALALGANHGRTTGTNLTTLDLGNFLLQAPADGRDESAPARVSSYQSFADSLRHHPTLSSFCLGFGFSMSTKPSSENVDLTGDAAHWTLTPLLEAVVTLPKLDCIRLEGARFAPRTALTPAGLATLCSASTTLTSLEVLDFDLSSDHVEALALGLGANSNLQGLVLTCHEFYGDHRPAVISLLAQALRGNRGLKLLYLPWKILLARHPGEESDQTDDDDANCDTALVEVFQALEVNSGLKHFQIKPARSSPSSPPSKPLQQAFRHMLQHNYGLESIQIRGLFGGEWEREIELHTRLNLMGRGRLVRNTNNATTRFQWMQAFGQAQDDLSCLFHLLLLNPLLCSSAGSTVQVS